MPENMIIDFINFEIKTNELRVNNTRLINRCGQKFNNLNLRILNKTDIYVYPFINIPQHENEI